MRKLTKAETDKRGTTRPSRTTKPIRAEYDGYPDPGTTLTPEQSAVYKRACDYLKQYGALMDIDATLIVSFAGAVVMRNQSLQLIAGEGLIQEYSNGTRAVSPELTVFTQTTALVDKFARVLGIGVKGRDGLAVFMEKEEEVVDKLAELMADVA